MHETEGRIEQLRNLAAELADQGASVRLYVSVDEEQDEEHGSDSEALAVEAGELERLQPDRSPSASASQMPAALQLFRGSEPLHVDRTCGLVLSGCAGSSLSDVHVKILNEAGHALTWAKAEQAGALTLNGRKVDGSRPLTGLKLPSSTKELARYRLTFTLTQEARGAGGAATLEADFVLRPEPGQPARWLVRRSGLAAEATAAADPRTSAGPLELRVGQALWSAFTIALVDQSCNVCYRTGLPRGVAPILRVRSGDDTAGPWLMVGGATSLGKGNAGAPTVGGAATRARQLVLDHTALDPNAGGDAIWLVATGGKGHVSLLGLARTSIIDSPKEELSVSDARGAYTQATILFRLRAGPPAKLRWLSAPPNVSCNNTTKLQVFGRLEAQLEDACGNRTIASDALVGATLSAQADYSTAESSQRYFPAEARLQEPYLSPFSTPNSRPPDLEGLVSNTIDHMSSKIVLGPAAVKRGSGKGSHYLSVQCQLQCPGTGGVFPEIELPDKLHVYFVDTKRTAAEGQDVTAAASSIEGAREAEKADIVDRQCEFSIQVIERRLSNPAKLASDEPVVVSPIVDSDEEEGLVELRQGVADAARGGRAARAAVSSLSSMAGSVSARPHWLSEPMCAQRQSVPLPPLLSSSSGVSLPSLPDLGGVRMDGSCGGALQDLWSASPLPACGPSARAAPSSVRAPVCPSSRKADGVTALGVARGTTPRQLGQTAMSMIKRETAHINVEVEKTAVSTLQETALARAREEQPPPLPSLGARRLSMAGWRGRAGL